MFFYLDLSLELCNAVFSDVFGLQYRLASLLIYTIIRELSIPKSRELC